MTSGLGAARRRSSVPHGPPVFLVWGPPSHARRSRIFARALGVELTLVYSTHRRGMLVAPAKYAYQAIATAIALGRRQPGLVLVQSPPSFAVMVVALYAALTGARYIVDAHSAAMLSPYWTRPRWLLRLVSRRATATVVTNHHFADQIESWGGKALVVRDIPAVFPEGPPCPLPDGFHVLVVNTFSADEPLGQVIEAARALDGVTFHVTGDVTRAQPATLADAPPNVTFTGFVPDEDYYALMRAADAVMCLTTRDHTMQRGACEALSLGRPIITSDWPLLRDYFRRGTVHVDNTAAGIRRGVTDMVEGHRRFRNEILALQSEQTEEWEAARRSLLTVVDAALAVSTGTDVRGAA